MRSVLVIVGVMLVGSSLAGCTPQAKYISSSTWKEGEIKFLYFKEDGDQGVIRCSRAADGALTGCKTMDIELVGE